MGLSSPVQGWTDHITTDSRQVRPGSVFVAIEGENVDGHRFVGDALARGAQLAVVHKAGDYPADRVLRVPNTMDAHIRMGAYYRSLFPDVRVAAITGSVGKTTTKEFIAAVLGSTYCTHKNQGNQNNEIGLPRTLFELSASHQAAVFELGMSALGDIAKLADAVRPEVGVITNVGVSHLEKLGSRENILKAKLELADALPDGAPLLLCGDNDLLKTVKNDRLQLIFYGLEGANSQIKAVNLRDEGEGTAFGIQSPWGSYEAYIPAIGQHNVYNALAAFGVGCVMGVAPEVAARALGGYEASGMRQRLVPFRGATIVEDCYNAAPDSVLAALKTLAAYPAKGRRIVVLSDMLELGEISERAHREAGAWVARLQMDVLVACGPRARGYVEGAQAHGMERCLYYDDPQKMAGDLLAMVRPGDVLWFKASRGMQLEKVLQQLYALQ